ncbi:hypothetical protein [Bogoriella caseilytica]|uniref:Uncharacterized protein n=1 Tax=Bogoriella caseilytica TaxID=56055 RepID=A0A3N2BAE8_9MICO|nr:hypothetical protein [Bogoriella caseilytica]ROR72168.1 hypothetical protein EDD31_0516 [Bogoriella caseilytica]
MLPSARPRSWTFEGRIAGWGTASGRRFVLGTWRNSPLGSFTDVMVEQPDGERILLAPHAEIADFVASTYTFDRTVLAPVLLRRTDADGNSLPDSAATMPGERWSIEAGPLTARVTLGSRTVLGWLLRGVPRRLASAPAFTHLTDPVARVLFRGVRTRGTAGGGRQEYYGATDLRRLVSAATLWDGESLGPLRPLSPPVRFGFGSAPRRPSVTDLVTTVREYAP